MMTVGNATNANNSIQGYQGGGIQMDATGKSIQNQIANAQKQLQELSSNDKMPLEEKMKKRQEIQQEISRLQQQLMQHQIEQRKQQAQKADLTMQQNQKPKPQEKRNGFSQPGMQAMLSADFSIKHAKVQGNVAGKMKDMANILKTEIKLDKGGNIEAKQAAIAELENKATEASSAQISILADANQEMKEAGKAEPGGKDVQGAEEKKEEGKEERTKGTDNNVENAGSVNGGVQDGITPPPVAYKPVDISL